MIFQSLSWIYFQMPRKLFHDEKPTKNGRAGKKKRKMKSAAQVSGVKETDSIPSMQTGEIGAQEMDTTEGSENGAVEKYLVIKQDVLKELVEQYVSGAMEKYIKIDEAGYVVEQHVSGAMEKYVKQDKLNEIVEKSLKQDELQEVVEKYVSGALEVYVKLDEMKKLEEVVQDESGAQEEMEKREEQEKESVKNPVLLNSGVLEEHSKQDGGTDQDQDVLNQKKGSDISDMSDMDTSSEEMVLRDMKDIRAKKTKKSPKPEGAGSPIYISSDTE